MISSPFPIVYADDMTAALAFYRDLLGFEEVYRGPPEGEPGYVEDPDGKPVHIRGPIG